MVVILSGCKWWLGGGLNTVCPAALLVSHALIATSELALALTPDDIERHLMTPHDLHLALLLSLIP